MNQYIKNLEEFPEVIQCESSNFCNAQCKMCPVWTDKMTRPRENMSRELFEKIVDGCINKPLKEFHLHQNGEPLCLGYWELAARISYVKQKLPTVPVGFFTNGSLMSMVASEKILQAKPDFITFSFQGGTKEDFEEIMGLDFNRVYAHIQNFMSIHKKLNSTTRIQLLMLAQKNNETHIKEFTQLFTRLGIEHISTGGILNYGSALNNDKIKHRFQRPTGNRLNPCWRLWTNLVIASNGKACLCCYDFDNKITLGDVRENTIQEIWQGDELKFYRKLHKKKWHDYSEVCKGCNYMEYTEIKESYYGLFRGEEEND